MIFTASSLSLTEPMCHPPRQRIDTFTPVLPSGRVGIPSPGFLSWARGAAEGGGRGGAGAGLEELATGLVRGEVAHGSCSVGRRGGTTGRRACIRRAENTAPGGEGTRKGDKGEDRISRR